MDTWPGSTRAHTLQEISEQNLEDEGNARMCAICLEVCNDSNEEAYDVLLGMKGGPLPKRDPRCYRLNCGHEMHVGCLARWISNGNRTCPHCRADIVPLDRANLVMRRSEPQWVRVPHSLRMQFLRNARFVFENTLGDDSFRSSSSSHDILNQFGDKMAWTGAEAAWIWGRWDRPEKLVTGNPRQSVVSIPLTNPTLPRIASAMASYMSEYPDDLLERGVYCVLNVSKGTWKVTINFGLDMSAPLAERLVDATAHFLRDYPVIESDVLGGLIPAAVSDSARRRRMADALTARFARIVDALCAP